MLFGPSEKSISAKIKDLSTSIFIEVEDHNYLPCTVKLGGPNAEPHQVTMVTVSIDGNVMDMYPCEYMVIRGSIIVDESGEEAMIYRYGPEGEWNIG